MTSLYMNTDNLVSQIKTANDEYRNGGESTISDEAYDKMTTELASREPNHPFLNQVEPEADFGKGKVRHSRPMLSTNKSYKDQDLAKWANKIDQTASDLGISGPIMVKLTAKLDGMAGRLENEVLSSRGDGLNGNDLTKMISKGLVITGSGDGEIVMPQAYFDEHLSNSFKHPRNVVTGIVSADNVRAEGTKALAAGAVHFATYQTLDFEIATTSNIVENLPALREKILASCPYPTDGIVIAVENEEIRETMGSTSHHHNWMIAAKTVNETAETVIEGIKWQVGRTSLLTPVIQIKPVTLSGALISNVNGYHAGNVKTAGLGIGAVIEVTRAGEVVPYLKDVISKADIVTIPDHCPCCNAPTSWEGAYLVCTNIKCHDRIKAQLNHFFSIIGTIDLFGPKACDLIVKSGVTRIFDVFQQTEQDFIGMGFGAGQASNLIKELREAKHRPVDDFLVLAAFGLSYLGRGDSKKLLRVCDLENVAHMTSEQILAIPGFGAITSSSIGSALPTISESLSFMCSYLEKIIHTGAKVVVEGSPISGKNIVFTGTMASGSRSEMVKHAESLGAISQSSINKLTNILVAGSKVGDSKIKKAEKLGTIVLSEEAYLVMIA